MASFAAARLAAGIAILRVKCYVFVHTFPFNPNFDLEPNYIIRYQQCTVRTEILPTFHTRVEYISQRHFAYSNE